MKKSLAAVGLGAAILANALLAVQPASAMSNIQRVSAYSAAVGLVIGLVSALADNPPAGSAAGPARPCAYPYGCTTQAPPYYGAGYGPMPAGAPICWTPSGNGYAAYPCGTQPVYQPAYAPTPVAYAPPAPAYGHGTAAFAPPPIVPGGQPRFGYGR
jgi:hypothetical protein